MRTHSHVLWMTQLTNKQGAIKLARYKNRTEYIHETICSVFVCDNILKYRTSGIIRNDTSMSKHKESVNLLLKEIVRLFQLMTLYYSTNNYWLCKRMPIQHLSSDGLGKACVKQSAQFTSVLTYTNLRRPSCTHHRNLLSMGSMC